MAETTIAYHDVAEKDKLSNGQLLGDIPLPEQPK
jgi:hypothetical protein